MVVVCRAVVRRLGGCSTVGLSGPIADGNELVKSIYQVTQAKWLVKMLICE
jgi:hypothetical protein